MVPAMASIFSSVHDGAGGLGSSTTTGVEFVGGARNMLC